MAKNYISILGIMGSGKSTLGNMLANELGYKFFEESFMTCPTLAKYYANPSKYALETEIWFLREKAMQHIEIGKYGDGAIQDSSIESSTGIFIPAMYSMGILTGNEFNLLNDLYHMFIKQVIPKPTQFIYLDVPVDVLMERVKKRGRDFESSCDVDYLMASVKAANNLVTFCSAPQHHDLISPLIVVDGSGTPNEIVDEILGKLPTCTTEQT